MLSLDTSLPLSDVHVGDVIVSSFADKYPEGKTGWNAAVAPRFEENYTTGRLRSCSFCGSLHPIDVVDAILAGAKGHFADPKYGWPHKIYFDNVPYPFAGMPEWTASTNSDPPSAGYSERMVRTRYDERTGQRNDHIWWYAPPRIAPATTSSVKFYSVHLKDATEEQKAIIEEHMRCRFTFKDGGVAWNFF